MKLATLLTAMSFPGAFGNALPVATLPGEVAGDIAGGTKSEPGSFPPAIVVVLLNGTQQCGGFLLNEHTVVTAAHCVYESPPSWFSVRAGSVHWDYGGVKVVVSRIISHPNATFDPVVDNDIALLKLSAPIRQSSTIRYATLPPRGFDPPACANTLVFGWGTTCFNCTESPPLRQMMITVVDHDTCQAAMTAEDNVVSENMFCAGAQSGKAGVCFGDSGSPAVDPETGVLWGIASWFRDGTTCTGPNLYDVFVRVGNYLDWLDKHKF